MGNCARVNIPFRLLLASPIQRATFATRARVLKGCECSNVLPLSILRSSISPLPCSRRATHRTRRRTGQHGVRRPNRWHHRQPQPCQVWAGGERDAGCDQSKRRSSTSDEMHEIVFGSASLFLGECDVRSKKHRDFFFCMHVRACFVKHWRFYGHNDGSER